MKKIGVIGAGFGGLAAAIVLAQKGYQVTILEKNNRCGGRANLLEHGGYRFDMGPSWYLMPDVFEQFFKDIGENIHDHLDLKKLDPNYTIFFKDLDKKISVSTDEKKNVQEFEKLEPGVTENFKQYLELSKLQYEIAMEFVRKNYDSWLDFFSRKLFLKSLKLRIFTTMSTYVKKFFKSDEMQKVIQYPLLFLGTSPYDAPAVYNIMSHVDFNMGVFYPMGGIHQIVLALIRIAEKHGVEIITDAEVEKILVKDGKSYGVKLIDGNHFHFDAVVSNADLVYSETHLLKDYPELQTYPQKYWEDKKIAPSAFIVYLGVDGKTPEMSHHNLIFCKDRKENFDAIFGEKKVPSDPSMYICVPSRTDSSVAPEGKENWFILVPIAPGLELDENSTELYYEQIIKTISKICNLPELLTRVEFRQIFQVKDFQRMYNAYQGTALGLAHTFFQSVIFRPDNVSKKIPNLFFTGAYNNPGIGMPMCLLSGQLVAQRVEKFLQ
ncbi:MAG TPA: phytoene desaturase family protein [Candidatus Absconditabacterales bacterium]|nr:phytoene desaturase family protein [Candidatus Absconditabacterales bacterium]HMT26964.1 phytoene desaturase family protein [Candidatus Absconditabacterales bacterium]